MSLFAKRIAAALDDLDHVDPHAERYPAHGGPAASTWPTAQTEKEAAGVPYIYDEAAAPPGLVTGDMPAAWTPPPYFIRPRKASGWSTWRAKLDGTRPVMLAGQHLGRTSLLVRNTDAATEVTVGPASDVSAGVHWPIAPGGQLSADHTGPLWATVPAGQTASVVMLAEYDHEKGGA